MIANIISNHINAELNEICKWLSSNKLFLNAPKTTDIDLTLKINDLHIDRVHEFNLLGTIIHETLEWTRHIDKVANKISRTLGILNKLKHVLPIYTLKTMYSALIIPHFNYNILLWGFNSKRISKFEKRQLES